MFRESKEWSFFHRRPSSSALQSVSPGASSGTIAPSHMDIMASVESNPTSAWIGVRGIYVADAVRDNAMRSARTRLRTVYESVLRHREVVAVEKRDMATRHAHAA